MSKYYLAIDPGYGDVKVFDGKKEFKFVNAIAYAGNTQGGIKNAQIEQFEFEGYKYLVGEDATYNDPMITRDYKYLEKYSPLLIYKVLKMLGVETTDEIHLVTGISIKDWHNKEEFGNRIKTIFVNGEQYKVKPKIIPQGVGIYEQYKATHEISEDFFAVIDIGFNTLDAFIFKDGLPFQKYYFANTNGVNKIVQQVINIISSKVPGYTDISEQDAKEILSAKKVRIANNYVDLSTDIQQEIMIYTEQTVNNINAKFSNIINKVVGCIIAGGGAYFLRENKVKMFDHDIYPNVPFEFANVIGYWEATYNEKTAKSN